MIGEELNIKIKERPVEEQRDYLLEHNMLLTGKIATLEKENAELKDDNKVMADNYSKMEQKFYDNLTKAKELMLRFIDLKNKPCAIGHSVNMLLYDNICTEVKQFLSNIKES